MWTIIVEKLLEYGILGIIAIFYFNNQNKKDNQSNSNFQQLFDNTLKTNKENMNKLTITIEKLGESIENSSRYYDNSMSIISQELLKLKQELSDNQSKLMQLILDGKELNLDIFKKVSELLIRNSMYNMLIQFYKFIDNGSFLEEFQIDELKDMVETTMETAKINIQKEFGKLNYDKLLLKNIDEFIDEKYIETWNNIENHILVPLGITDMMRDHNNNNLKNKMTNKLTILANEIMDYIEDKVR